jgi:hypothetical protein
VQRKMLELNFSSELNVGTKSGHIWYFFLGTKTKLKPKNPEKTMVVIVWFSFLSKSTKQ